MFSYKNMLKLIATSAEIEKNVLAKGLYDSLEMSVKDDNATLYYKFPFYKGDVKDDLVEAQMLLLSPKYGIFLFDYENKGNVSDDMRDKMDNLYVEVSSRIKKIPQLRLKRDSLKYEIKTVFVGNSDQINDDYEYWHADEVEHNIASCLLDEAIPESDLLLLESCVEGTTGMIKKQERTANINTKAYILNEIQNQIATFDVNQKKSAEIDIDAPQRIRGLAGSGKTVILAYKAAIYHMRHPNDEILYTFYTKSLAETVRDIIRHAYKSLGNNEDPNWEKISVIHAWGSRSSEGVYYNACLNNGVIPLSLEDARRMSPYDNPFAYICGRLVTLPIEKKYDLVIIDEGQDFPVEFYRLCWKLCKTQRVCWAYDDFQNIFNVTIQDEKKTFGSDENGVPMVDFSKLAPTCDVVLQKCYRTPRFPLICAFSLGLGIYNDKVLQRIGSVALWESLGFKVESGNAQTGDEMVISRPKENTPSYSNEVFDNNSVKYIKCSDIDAECRYITQNIIDAIGKEGLLPSDICVICLDNRNIETYFNKISSILIDERIPTFNLLNASYSNTTFSVEGRVTLSTVNKAKGNETGMVFVCGIDRIFNDHNNVVLRNQLFTSMTRTKGWLILSGVGDSMDRLSKELSDLQNNNFKLLFKQPSEQVTKTIEDVSRRSLTAQNTILAGIKALKDLGLSMEEMRAITERALQ